MLSNQWKPIKGTSHVLLITWSRACLWGLLLLLAGAATVLFSRSLLARIVGGVMLVAGLTLVVLGAMLYSQVKR